MLFSYLIAAMVGGAGVLAAWAWQASHDREVHVAALRARAAQQARQDSPALAPGAVVGKITRLTSRAWGGHLAAGRPGRPGQPDRRIGRAGGDHLQQRRPGYAPAARGFHRGLPRRRVPLVRQAGALAANPRNAAGRQGAARTAPTAARQSFCICTPRRR